jgi:hypothetical protein
MSALTLEWIDAGREAECPPDPAYPNGIDLVERPGLSPSCRIAFPCPAPRCGVWSVVCTKCGRHVIVTAAGRVDDPRSLTVACKDARGPR